MGLSKGSAESTQIFEGLRDVNLDEYDNLFKLSGRYWLNDNFDYDNYANNLNIFKEGPNKSALATVFYKVNKKDYKLYSETIDFCKNSSDMLEKNFVKFFANKYGVLNKLGVSGNVSIDGNPIDW